ncbi:MAG TPA: hypothetical protein VHR72_11525 [Gemmataceae bacterium]|nr:hypothetical protein [Gemmataceae bacterium]
MAPANLSNERVLSIGFHPGDKQLVAIMAAPGQLGRALIWDLSSHKAVWTESAASSPLVATCTPGGMRIALGDRDGSVHLFDFRERKWTALAAHGVEIRDLAIAADGSFVLSAGADGTIMRRLAKAGAPGQTVPSGVGDLRAIALFRNGQTIVFGGHDAEVFVQDLVDGRKKTLGDHGGGVDRIAVSADDRLIVTASRYGEIRSWNAQTGTKSKAVTISPGLTSTTESPHFALAFSPKEPLLAIGAGDGAIHLWNPETGQALGLLDSHSGRITSVVFSADGRIIASGSAKGVIKLWTLADRREITTLSGANAFPSPPALAAPPAHAAAPVPAAPPFVKISDLYQSFRDSWRPAGPWAAVGSDVGAVSQPDPRGFRITLPAKRRQTDSVGLTIPARIRGDFEITAGYEILQSSRPTEGHGVGFEVFLTTDTPTNEALGFTRAARVMEGEIYLTSRITTQDGKRQYHHGFEPTSAKAGYLRIRRTGIEAILSASEDSTGTFREVGRFDLGPEDVNRVRLSAYPGHAQNTLDLLIKDFRLRSPGGGTQTATTPSPGQPDVRPDAREPKRGWIGLTIILVLMLVGAAVGTWLFFRKRMTGSTTPSAPSAPPPAIKTTCAGCGKVLRARPELAGKKIKCPQCGGLVVLSAAGPAEVAGNRK